MVLVIYNVVSMLKLRSNSTLRVVVVLVVYNVVSMFKL